MISENLSLPSNLNFLFQQDYEMNTGTWSLLNSSWFLHNIFLKKRAHNWSLKRSLPASPVQPLRSPIHWFPQGKARIWEQLNLIVGKPCVGSYPLGEDGHVALLRFWTSGRLEWRSMSTETYILTNTHSHAYITLKYTNKHIRTNTETHTHTHKHAYINLLTNT